MEISGNRRTSLPALRSSETKRLRASTMPPPSIAACKTAAEVDIQDGNVSSWIRGSRFNKSLGWRMSCMAITASL